MAKANHLRRETLERKTKEENLLVGKVLGGGGIGWEGRETEILS